MKLHFSPNQDYQLRAIQSIVGLFKGQPINDREFPLTPNKPAIKDLMETGFGNQLILTEEEISANVGKVQQENHFYPLPDFKGMNFTVEMETGTGKTYVYLRTIYELNQIYGFSKFVIVVPSIAIREGVLKNLEITHEHLQNLYSRIPVNYAVYDSKKVSALRNFAAANTLQILVINIDSFTKDANIINQQRDSTYGRKPIEFIQSTRPIVILDEPQNMETAIRRKGIENLNPLCTLRYSATHKVPYNLVYRLGPVQAYDMGLVKQIEVDSVMAENASNEAFISLESIKATKTKLTAKVKIEVNSPEGPKRKSVSVDSKHFDLYELSGHREVYKDLTVNDLNAQDGYIELSNGTRIYSGETKGGLMDEVMKVQIRKSVEEHFSKEKRLKEKGIKVLSLFFIDRVANYREYNDSGNPGKGKFANWFEEIYTEFASKAEYKDVIPFTAEQVHNGYFAQDKKGVFKDTNGETKADDDAYHLIMQDKERLLDMKEPLRFIFSHSALREGWDSPNVFQICTLNETRSDMKKRQEIGRGLRLCVDQDGNRVHDKHINRLTVVANESYEDFAKRLQTEIEEDCGEEFKGRIKDKANEVTVRARKGFEIDEKFLDLWNRIKHRTQYSVNYDTPELIIAATKAVRDMPEVHKPVIRTRKGDIAINEEGVSGIETRFRTYEVDQLFSEVPDVLGYIQSKTELTRSTILEILKKSSRLSELLNNPQLFLDLAVKAIKETLDNLMIEGIQYTKNGNVFEMELFEEEFTTYQNHLKVIQEQKTVYDYILCDSDTEVQFAQDCENNPDVEFYIKLPAKFIIQTPIGEYRPDWALIFKEEKKLYFVAETKSSLEESELRGKEARKIKCGKAHFEEFKRDGVEFKAVKKLGDLR